MVKEDDLLLDMGPPAAAPVAPVPEKAEKKSRKDKTEKKSKKEKREESSHADEAVDIDVKKLVPLCKDDVVAVAVGFQASTH